MTAAPSRSIRAVSGYVSVIRDAPDRYTVVSESGREYAVDLRDDPAHSGTTLKGLPVHLLADMSSDQPGEPGVRRTTDGGPRS